MSFKEVSEFLQSKEKSRINRRLLKNTNKKVEPVKRMVLLLTALGTLFSFTACNVIDNNNIENESKITSVPIIMNTAQQTQGDENTYIDRYNGEYYLFATQDYVYELLKTALTDIEQMLGEVEGITPVGTQSGKFYPKYFNADMFSAIAFTESTFRIEKSDGSPLVSHTGAVGMCQIEPIAIDTVNKWLRDTMGLNIRYTLDDANDPQKALEISILYNIRNCKNKAKEGKPIYNQMGVDFSLEMQEKLLYAMYFYGEGNVENSAINGTIMDTYLNPEWKDDNGNNYVYDILKNKEYLINIRTQNIDKDYSR